MSQLVPQFGIFFNSHTTMRRPHFCSTAAVILSLCHSVVSGQLPTSEISRLQPRSGRPGETVEVELHGENLEDVTELRFTHAGITATPVMLPEDEFFPSPRMDGTKFNVTVDESVPPGIYEARAVGYFGLSKSRPFVIASPESTEIIESGKNKTAATAMTVNVNSIVSGEVASRGVDWFRFRADANQRVLVELFAERIDSRMDGQLIVYDSRGREIARDRDTYGRDSFLEIQPENAGEFTIAVSDILYRGGPDYFYRMKIHASPHIDFVWPPAITAGTKQAVVVYGRNLPGGILDQSTSLTGHSLERLEVEVTAPNDAVASSGFVAGTPSSLSGKRLLA